MEKGKIKASEEAIQEYNNYRKQKGLRSLTREEIENENIDLDNYFPDNYHTKEEMLSVLSSEFRKRSSR